MRYLRTVNETLSIADYLDTRMTCGNHTYPPTYEDVGSSAWATAVALAFFVAAAAVSVVVRAYGPRWCSNAQHREPGGVSGQHEQAMNARAQQTASRYGAVDADDMVAPDRTDGTLPLKDDAQPPNPGEGFEGKDSDGDYGGVLLRAFDFGVNFKRLFTVDDGNRGEFRALDGLRVLSILWVILGHSLAELNEVGFSNPTNALPPNGLTHEVGAQLFFSARLAVDTFLLLSGFLVTLGMLRRFGFPADSAVVAKASPSWHKWVPAFYLNRVLRILPLYAACLGFFWKIAPSLYSGPFWFAWDGYVDKCERLWWTNLLFINNIVPSDGSETDGCFYWAWYLALDMQFAVFLAPPALCLYFKSSRHGGVFVLACLVASVAAGFWYSLQTGISASSFDGIWVGEYSRKFYTKPWFRAPPYLVGIYTAMLWMDKEGSGLRGGNDTWNCFRDFFPTAVGGGNRKRSPSAGWCSSTWLAAVVALLAWVTFGPVGAYQHLPCPYDQAALPHFAEQLHCGSHWTLMQRAVFNAFAPLAWSCGVAMLCLLCFRGRGGWIGQLLGHPVWVPFARLSYGAYLIHPIVLNFMVLSRSTKVRLDVMYFVSFYVAASTLTFCITAVAVLLVESPIACLTKAVFDKGPSSAPSGAWVRPYSGQGLQYSRSLPSTASIELSSPAYTLMRTQETR